MCRGYLRPSASQPRATAARWTSPPNFDLPINRTSPSKRVRSNPNNPTLLYRRAPFRAKNRSQQCSRSTSSIGTHRIQARVDRWIFSVEISCNRNVPLITRTDQWCNSTSRDAHENRWDLGAAGNQNLVRSYTFKQKHTSRWYRSTTISIRTQMSSSAL